MDQRRAPLRRAVRPLASSERITATMPMSRDVAIALRDARWNAHYFGHRPCVVRLIVGSPFGRAHYTAVCPCGHRYEVIEYSDGLISTRVPDYWCRR